MKQSEHRRTRPGPQDPDRTAQTCRALRSIRSTCTRGCGCNGCQHALRVSLACHLSKERMERTRGTQTGTSARQAGGQCRHLTRSDADPSGSIGSAREHARLRLSILGGTGSATRISSALLRPGTLPLSRGGAAAAQGAYQERARPSIAPSRCGAWTVGAACRERTRAGKAWPRTPRKFRRKQAGPGPE